MTLGLTKHQTYKTIQGSPDTSLGGSRAETTAEQRDSTGHSLQLQLSLSPHNHLGVIFLGSPGNTVQMEKRQDLH